VARDVRKDEPYAAYDEMQFDIAVGTKGDTYERYLVRSRRSASPARIVRQAIEGMPEGPIMGRCPG